jgi:hypothetical protein
MDESTGRIGPLCVGDAGGVATKESILRFYSRSPGKEKEMIEHLKRDEGENILHISHLFRYVSAYHYSEEMAKNLLEDLHEAIRKAKETKEGVIVDQDGEMFFLVSPAGNIQLCLRWKTYRFPNDKDPEFERITWRKK